MLSAQVNVLPTAGTPAGVPRGRAFLGPLGAVEVDASGSPLAASVVGVADRRRIEGAAQNGLLLFPDGANCPLKAVRGERLVPAGLTPARKAPVGAEALRWWAEVDAILSAGQAGPADDAERQEVLGNAFSAGFLAAGAGAIQPMSTYDACKCSSWWRCLDYNKVRIQLGDVDTCIPADWYYDRMRSGFMHEDATIDLLWGIFRKRGGGLGRKKWKRHTNFCAIDLSKATSGRSYRLLFADRGAPEEFLYYTADLIYRTTDFITDEWTGSPRCVGFGGFVYQLLDGQVADGQGDYACELMVQPASSEGKSGSGGEYTAQCRKDGVKESNPTTACRDVSKKDIDLGGGYDEWSAWLICPGGANSGPWAWSADQTSAKEPPHTGNGYAKPETFRVRVSARGLAFRSWVVDYTMYWARALLEYGIEMFDLSKIGEAVALARLVLRLLADEGELLLHEFGRLYMGEGGHCTDDIGCCFDIAAKAWWVRTLAFCGAPSTWGHCEPAEYIDDECQGCSEDTDGFKYYRWTSRRSFCDPGSAPWALGASSCGSKADVCT